MKTIPSHYELIAARVEFADLLFDVYAFDDDGTLTLGAVCSHGAKVDLYDILSDSACNHFLRLVEDHNPEADERHERGMDVAAAYLLGCSMEAV